MDNIRRYLEKHDGDYKEKRKKENIDGNFKQSLIKQLSSQNEKQIDKLNGSISGLAGKLDMVLLDKISGEIGKKTGPRVVEEFKKVVEAMPKVTQKEMGVDKLVGKLDELKKAVSSIDIPEPYEPETLTPLLKSIEKSVNNIKFPIQQFPNEMSFKEAKDLDNRLKDLIVAVKKIKPGDTKVDFSGVEKAVVKLGEKLDKIKTPEVEFPEVMSVTSVDPVYKPTPVTNININPLRGLVHPTTTTVKATLTGLPGYGVLSNRRSLIFYNNSSSTTVYIGGSTVTTSNGLPIEAGNYSPSFDSGPLQEWYGVTSSGTADIRCIEIANTSGA